MRRWVSLLDGAAVDSGEDWGTVYQISVPCDCRLQVLKLAHESLWCGHPGITKTYNRNPQTLPLARNEGICSLLLHATQSHATQSHKVRLNAGTKHLSLH